MSEFDHLWECAVKMHKALEKPGTLALIGNRPEFNILVQEDYGDSYTAASGESACDVVRSLIATYIRETSAQIQDVKFHSDLTIKRLEDTIALGKSQNC